MKIIPITVMASHSSNFTTVAVSRFLAMTVFYFSLNLILMSLLLLAHNCRCISTVLFSEMG